MQHNTFSAMADRSSKKSRACLDKVEAIEVVYMCSPNGSSEDVRTKHVRVGCLFRPLSPQKSKHQRFSRISIQSVYTAECCHIGSSITPTDY
jgi:hypothetical protein